MHYLHAILVHLEEDMGEMSKEEILDNVEQVKKDARSYAMNETEGYGNGDVFDWRTDGDAGRWDDEFPGVAVILGAEEPERFFKELEIHSKIPMENATESLQWLEYNSYTWRTQEELDADPELVIIPNPKNGIEMDGKNKTYWSGKKNPPLIVNQQLLDDLWNRKVDPMLGYGLRKALRLADGDYTSDACFFYVPDHTTRLSDKRREDIKANPHKYALVFSDYHN